MTISTWQRLNQLIDMLTDSYPDGLSTSELAEQLDVTRQTTYKDITRLTEWQVPIIETSPKPRYAIDPRDHIRPLRLTLSQAWQLYLPLRRIVRAQQHEDQLVHSLLKRLATSLDSTLAAQLLPDVAPKPDENRHFEQLVDAWREKHWIEVLYEPPNGTAKRHLIAPYWFEPAVWTDGTYLIAGLQGRGEIVPVTLKLNRIRKLATRMDTFERPAPEKIVTRLQQTWGIWLGDEPQRVRLRFANRTRQRLFETRWHPSEQKTDQPDGSVLWEAQVEEPQEMLPWCGRNGRTVQ